MSLRCGEGVTSGPSSPLLAPRRSPLGVRPRTWRRFAWATRVQPSGTRPRNLKEWEELVRGRGLCQKDPKDPKIKKRHTHGVLVSDLGRERPIWFGGKDRSEASLDEFFKWLGPKNSAGIRLGVIDMWKAFSNSTAKNAPKASVLFEEGHLGAQINRRLLRHGSRTHPGRRSGDQGLRVPEES